MRPQHVTDIEPATPNGRRGQRRIEPPPKPCANPECRKMMHRKPNESLYKFNQRDTCSKRCGKHQAKLNPKGSTRPENMAYAQKGDVTCVLCSYRHEDSDFGKHCGPCTTGQFFQRRET